MLFRLILFYLFFFLTHPVYSQPLNIAITHWAGYAVGFLAKEQGFFDKYEVEVELVIRPEVPDVVKLYKEGKVDGTFLTFPDVVVLNMENIPTQAVYLCDYSKTADLIIARPEFKQLSDLKGKRVAFEGKNTFSHLFVVKMLERTGVPESEFTGVELLSSQVLQALETNQLDAGHIYGNTTSQALKKGYRVLAKAIELPGLLSDVLAFKTTIIEERSSEVQKVVKALVEAMDFLTTHPEKALLVMTKIFGLPHENIQDTLRGLKLPNLQENIAAFQAGGLFRAGQHTMEFYLKRQKELNPVEIRKVIAPQFVLGIEQKTGFQIKE